MANHRGVPGNPSRRPATEAERLRYQEPCALAYAGVNAATLGAVAQAAAIGLCIVGLFARAADVLIPLMIFGSVVQIFAVRAFAIAIGRLVVAHSRIRAGQSGASQADEQPVRFIE